MSEQIIKLDLKDKKLIQELDFNGRATYSELGKKIGLSKQGVEYKLNSLINKGVITGFYPVINSPKLGYIYCRFVFSFRNITENKEKEIINYLKKEKKIFWIFTLQGIYDMAFVVWSKDISEFRETTNNFLLKYGKYIKNKNESLPTDVIHYQIRYLLNNHDAKEINIKETQNIVKIDETDIKILKSLCNDARKSLVDIGNELKLSAKVISYRIKNLEKNKIIEGYRPLINNSILGFTYYKLWISINYESKEKIEELYNYIKTKSIIIYIVKGIGFPEDLDVEIMIKDNQELFDFIKDLKNKFPNLIGDYKSFMFRATEKVRYLPF